MGRFGRECGPRNAEPAWDPSTLDDLYVDRLSSRFSVTSDIASDSWQTVGAGRSCFVLTCDPAGQSWQPVAVPVVGGAAPRRRTPRLRSCALGLGHPAPGSRPARARTVPRPGSSTRERGRKAPRGTGSAPGNGRTLHEAPFPPRGLRWSTSGRPVRTVRAQARSLCHWRCTPGGRPVEPRPQRGTKRTETRPETVINSRFRSTLRPRLHTTPTTSDPLGRCGPVRAGAVRGRAAAGDLACHDRLPAHTSQQNHLRPCWLIRRRAGRAPEREGSSTGSCRTNRRLRCQSWFDPGGEPDRAAGVGRVAVVRQLRREALDLEHARPAPDLQQPVPRRAASLTSQAGAMRSAAVSWSSCSHTTTTVQPSSASRAVVSASRATVRASFVSHHSVFDFGIEWWDGQRCQKQDPDVDHDRAREKTMSQVRRGSSFTCSR